MELFKANSQWSTRPADQRFESLQDLYNATRSYYETAGEKMTDVTTIRTEAIDGDVKLVGRAGVPAVLTHWSFGQLASRIGAPASYLRELPATLAVNNLNHGLAQLAKRDDGQPRMVNLLFHQNGSLLLRAFTSDKYSRIWNHEVAARLLQLEQNHGWEPARPDKHWTADIPVGTCIMCQGRLTTPVILDGRPGEHVECQYCNSTGREYPALYASDHDMFAFIRNRSAVVREPGNPDGLQRGVIVENSEVGASALKLTRFLYREMCGNHIIWGASKTVEISVRHVGDARNRWGMYQYELKRYAESSASDDEAKIASAKTMTIASSKDEVLDKLFGMRALNLSRKTLESGYDACQPDVDGSPKTVWGMVQGLTRHSQTAAYADSRTTIDRAAGKLMEVAF